MALTLITGPTTEPVELSRVKLHLRVDATDEDALIASYIASARDTLEQHLGRALLTQTWDLFLDGFPGTDTITVPMPPLQSVTGVYYTPDGSAEATFASASYGVDTASTPGRIWLKTGYSWPTDTLQPYSGVRVRFVAGWTAAASVPPLVVQALLLMVGQSYEHRQPVEKVSDEVDRMLWPWRVVPV